MTCEGARGLSRLAGWVDGICGPRDIDGSVLVS